MKVFLSFWAMFCFNYVPTHAQNKPYCQLKGSVYASSTKQGADYWIYEDETEGLADFLIYEEENKLYADEPGVWHFVDSPNLADFIVFFTEERSEADFIVFFIDSNTFAGCK